jgi:hypothetical protein
MNLQGRDLKRDLRGDDVALLYRELATIESRIHRKATIALRMAYRPI